MADISKISMERIDNLDVTIADINADISSVETTILQNISTQIASLNAKITSIETTISSMKYVTETNSSNDKWYRVWSDGWIEQGGRVPTHSSYGYQPILFLKEFSDTNYTIQGSMIFTTSSSAGDYRCVRNLTTTGCDMAYNGSEFSYYACGY